jgi:ferredoxin-NADP reductase
MNPNSAPQTVPITAPTMTRPNHAPVCEYCEQQSPIRALFRHQFRVVEVRRENPDVVTVYIIGRHLGELRTEAGQFFRWRFVTRDLWCVGITPLRTLFETLPGDPGDITMIDLPSKPQRRPRPTRGTRLDRTQPRRHSPLPARPSATRSRDHLSAERLTRLVPDVNERDVFLCGPEPMMAAAQVGLRAAGVPRRHIHLESFTF